MFWTPEKAVEKIREANDEKLIPLKDRSGAALTPAEELDLVADVFGGDVSGGGVSRKRRAKKSASSRDASRNDSRANSKSARLESLAARLQNWKELVIPELLERVTKYNIKKQYAAGAEQLRMAKDEAAAATEQAAAEAGRRRAAP